MTPLSKILMVRKSAMVDHRDGVDFFSLPMDLLFLLLLVGICLPVMYVAWFRVYQCLLLVTLAKLLQDDLLPPQWHFPC